MYDAKATKLSSLQEYVLALFMIIRSLRLISIELNSSPNHTIKEIKSYLCIIIQRPPYYVRSRI